MTPLAAEWVAKAEGDYATARRELLAKLLLTAHVTLKTLSTALRTLSAYAVETRYPGRSADRALAREALELCSRCRLA